jgi:hypothetical protein
VRAGRAEIFKVAYDEAHKALSPGTLVTALVMEHVLEVDRVREVDYLTGDDAVGHCAGGLLATGTAHLDTTVFVTHTGLRGESRQVFKTVLDGQARSVKSLCTHCNKCMPTIYTRTRCVVTERDAGRAGTTWPDTARMAGRDRAWL